MTAQGGEGQAVYVVGVGTRAPGDGCVNFGFWPWVYLDRERACRAAWGHLETEAAIGCAEHELPGDLQGLISPADFEAMHAGRDTFAFAFENPDGWTWEVRVRCVPLLD